MLKKYFIGVFFTIFILNMMTSCGQGNDSVSAEQQRFQDSIMNANAEMAQFISTIAQELDSINQGPLKVLSNTDGEGNKISTKQQILNNIEAYQNTVDQQRQRIDELEKQLANNKSENAKKMKEIVDALKAQLAQKDQEIAVLREQISQKDFNINQLKSHVSTLQTNVEELEQQTKEQEEALVAQNEILNEAYVLIGTKKQLQAAGVLSNGNLLKKSKLKQSDFDPSKFNKVDIRNYKQVQLGKDAKILTPAPESSYSLVKNSDGTYTLTIKDADSFWSISPFLVIQTK